MEEYTVTTAVKIPVHILPADAHPFVAEAVEDYFRWVVGITGRVNTNTNEFIFPYAKEYKLIDLDWSECSEHMEEYLDDCNWFTEEDFAAAAERE